MADLESQLRSLAGRDDLFPATPDVSADIASRTVGARRASRLDWRMVAIVALVLLAAIAAALAIPTSRTAIADFFGIEGIRIEFGQDDDPDVPATPASIGGQLLLGDETTLEAALDVAPFEVVTPGNDAAGGADEIYLNQRDGVTVVGMLWHASDDLPEIGDTGVGMLLLEIEADDDEVVFAKKTAIGGGELRITDVNDSTGYWITNGVLTVAPVTGLMRDEFGPESRRSGNVLIWSDGEITYRLETSLEMEDAVRIAESLTPVRGAGRP